MWLKCDGYMWSKRDGYPLSKYGRILYISGIQPWILHRLQSIHIAKEAITFSGYGRSYCKWFHSKVCNTALYILHVPIDNLWIYGDLIWNHWEPFFSSLGSRWNIDQNVYIICITHTHTHTHKHNANDLDSELRNKARFRKEQTLGI